jgi:hypothetical protein
MALSGVTSVGDAPASSSADKGRHYQFVKDKLPPWLVSATPHRQRDLRKVGLKIPYGYAQASAAHKQAFKTSSQQGFSSQSSVDKVLAGLQEVKAFARPLLQAAIVEQFKITVDVDRTVLRHWVANPQPLSDAIQLSSSLLDAALHNFTEDDETAIYGSTRSVGTVLLLSPQGKLPFSAEQFAGLCRKLDLGAKYQAHVNSVLGMGNSADEVQLQASIKLSQQDTFATAIELARLQGDIHGDDVYTLLHKVKDQAPDLVLDGKPVQLNGLRLLGDTDLSGVLLIGPKRIASDVVQRLIVYIPHDPVSPIKEYASAQQFHLALREKLRDPAYQLFFSRFIKQSDKARFFQRLNDRLTPFKAVSGSKVQVRVPDPNARIAMEETPVTGNYWVFLVNQQLNKLLDDTRSLAVSTADADAQARHDKMLSYLGIALSVLNVVALFVPPLGVAMMAVMAVQLTDELVEGVEALAQGEKDEGFAYLMDVAQNVAQLALMAAAGGGSGEQVTGVGRSEFFASLKPVTLANGEVRLWKPDLAPYEHKGALPEDLEPNELGLLQHDGQEFLPLADKRYAVSKDPVSGKYRIAHPEQADAYFPELHHNGGGAWRHELERPQTWQGPELMRRLGHRVSDYSDVELEQVRRVSGVDESILRRMHLENQAPPTALDDTLRRFDAYRQVERFIADLQGGEPRDVREHSINQLHVLTRCGQWPEALAVRLLDAQAATVREFTAQGAQKITRVVNIQARQLTDGRLLQTLLDALEQTDTNALLGRKADSPLDKQDTQIARLKEQIVKLAQVHKVEFFNDLYSVADSSSDPRLTVLQSRFPSVSRQAIEELLASANRAEQRQMARWNFTDKLQTKPIPLRLAEELRSLQRDVRLSRAYEGLFLEGLINRDAEVLVLNSLEKLSGWSGDVRLEIREAEFNGDLRVSIGAEEAASRKVLVRVEQGRYEARDQDDGHLHGADDIYAALQHALPDAQRQAIALPHVGQGAELKALIRQHLLTPVELRTRLGMQPVKPGFRAPKRLADGRLGYPLSGRGAGVSPQQAADEARVRNLFPGYTDGQVSRFLLTLGQDREFYLVNFEADYQRLLESTRQWLASPTSRTLADGSEVAVDAHDKQAVVELLKRSWRKLSTRYSAFGYPRGYELVLRGRTVGALPILETSFSGVEFVDMSGMDLMAAPNEFLDSFPDVRWLDLHANRMADIPMRLGQMDNLVGLNLSGNNLRLSAEEAASVSSLKKLKKLQLSHNPLERVPDFSQMRELSEIRLQGTGISQWPDGLLGLNSLEKLDLRDNQITEFPLWAVSPPPEQVDAIDRLLKITELNGNPLSPQGVQQYADILERIYRRENEPGLIPGPVDEPAARGAEGGVLASSTQRLERWLGEVPEAQLARRKELWQRLDTESLDREEAGGELGRGVSESEEFFRLLEKLSQSAEFRKAYGDLQARVWIVLEAAADNTQLREELFRAAGEPQTCSDRAALMFSDLEVRVQIHKALARVGEEGAGRELLKLAKGLFRLDQVEAFALKDIRERVAIIMHSGLTKREIGRQLVLLDQIEVRLSYRISLRQRLDLPGQPVQADYTGVQYVPEPKLAEAERQIKSLKNSLAEIDSITQRDFWREYLKDKYRSRFDLAYESIIERMEHLELIKVTLTSEVYNARYKALRDEAEAVQVKLINLLTPQEILNLEEEQTP